MFSRMCTSILLVALFVTITVPAGNLFADDCDVPRDGDAAAPVKVSDEAVRKQAERANNAAAVLNEIMNIPEQGIPEALLKEARAIAVIPSVYEGAIGLGGRYGKGLLSVRDETGYWTAPAFITIRGGSLGLQLGVQSTDLILVFTDEDAINGLLKGHLTLGADASATAGPVGRNAEVGVDILLKSGIWSYSRSRGLFAGISLDGTVINIDDSANHKVYQACVSGQDILQRDRVEVTNVVEPFVTTLEDHAGTPTSKAR